MGKNLEPESPRPPHRRFLRDHDRLAAAERRAREARKGFWAEEDVVSEEIEDGRGVAHGEQKGRRRVIDGRNFTGWFLRGISELSRRAFLAFSKRQRRK